MSRYMQFKLEKARRQKELVEDNTTLIRITQSKLDPRFPNLLLRMLLISSSMLKSSNNGTFFLCNSTRSQSSGAISCK